MARRYTALASLASLVAAAGTSGGLDVALGPNVGATPLSVLGTQIVLQFLTSGAVPDARKSIAALPLVSLASLPRCDMYAKVLPRLPIEMRVTQPLTLPSFAQHSCHGSPET